MPDRASKALTAARAVLEAARTMRTAVETAMEVERVPAMIDDAGQYHAGGDVEYRDPQADEIQADLDRVIEILSKYAPVTTPPKTLQERRKQS